MYKYKSDLQPYILIKSYEATRKKFKCILRKFCVSEVIAW